MLLPCQDSGDTSSGQKPCDFHNPHLWPGAMVALFRGYPHLLRVASYNGFRQNITFV